MTEGHYEHGRFDITSDRMFKTPILYNGMMFSNRSPTDIDASMDINGECFIFFEVKYDGTETPIGQARHLKSLCDGLIAGGKKATALVVSAKRQEGAIMLKDCRLKYGCGTDINKLAAGMTAQEATKKLLSIWKGTTE